VPQTANIGRLFKSSQQDAHYAASLVITDLYPAAARKREHPTSAAHLLRDIICHRAGSFSVTFEAEEE
jgi:hypothetical protein